MRPSRRLCASAGSTAWSSGSTMIDMPASSRREPTARSGRNLTSRVLEELEASGRMTAVGRAKLDPATTPVAQPSKRPLEIPPYFQDGPRRQRAGPAPSSTASRRLTNAHFVGWVDSAKRDINPPTPPRRGPHPARQPQKTRPEIDRSNRRNSNRARYHNLTIPVGHAPTLHPEGPHPDSSFASRRLSRTISVRRRS